MSGKDKTYDSNLINSFIEQISKEYNVSSVYLFGSYCYGNPDKNSDIDVAVILDEPVDDAKDFDIFRRAQKLDLNLEAVVFNIDEFNQDASDLVVEIKNKGEKIA